jgi:6-phosphogluconolactonase
MRSHTADVHVHPSGRFVYGSNRGHDSIVAFAVDDATGALALIGHESTRGQTPRNFTLDLTGHHLYAANQRTDNVVAYKIDESSGRLSPTGQEFAVPTPVCVKLLRIG